MASKLLDRLSISSKKSSKSSMSSTSQPQPVGAPAAAAEAIAPKPTSKAKIAVLVYSIYGHQKTMSDAFAEGLKQAEVTYDLYQIEEILSEEALTKMHANKAVTKDLPVITAEKLTEYDGFVICAGTRYGRLPAAVSAFFDRTGGQWSKGSYVSKMATFVTSAASQHGGLETVSLTSVSFLAHHGAIYVPMGFTTPDVFETTEVIGSSAWGASTITAGDGHLQPTTKDLATAKHHGNQFGRTVAQFVRGKQ